MGLTSLALVFALHADAARVDTARLVEERVVVEPLGASVAAPPFWLGAPAPAYYPQHWCALEHREAVGDRIVVGPERLAALSARIDSLRSRGRAVEWIREYAAAADSALPFGAVVAQLGGAAWGAPCEALHVRVYVTDLAPGALDTAAARGAAAAARFFAPVRREAADSAGWHVARLSWEAWYSDYGGTARMEFWARRVGGRTLVLVFMGRFEDTSPHAAAERGDRDAILASLRTRPSTKPVSTRRGV